MNVRFAGVLRVMVMGALSLLLAGCVITSKQPLVQDADATPVLPQSFFMFGYDEGDGSFARNTEAPAQLILQGHSYVSTDNTLTVRFVPLPAAENTYLVAIAGGDGNVYGVGRLRDNILSVNIVLSDSDPGKIIEAEKASGAAGADVLADVTVEDTSLNITTRAALDYLISMNLAGKLPLDPVIAYVGDSENADVPTRIVADGAYWKAE